MASANSHRGDAPAGLLSIGQVLARFAPEFPGLTASKLRFLEVQGIVTPTRTESGYRKFSASDLERLRLALQLQRDQYLPLSVICDYLDDVDAGREPSLPQVPDASIHPRGKRYRRDELAALTGAATQLITEAVQAGLLPAADSYDERELVLVRTLVALERAGIEPRHLRGVRAAAERDVALVEAALAPLTRRGDAASRGRAAELAPELVRRIDEVWQSAHRAALSRSELGRLLQ